MNDWDRSSLFEISFVFALLININLKLIFVCKREEFHIFALINNISSILIQHKI